MSSPDTGTVKQSMRLRSDAESRLKDGSAPPTVGWSLGVTALGLIQKLASSPTSAADALKLLHEVQVHQVELDLQHQQIDAIQRELGEDLAYYRELYEHAPVAYLTVGPRREVLECNLAAVDLLGTAQDEASGRSIESFLAASSRDSLQRMLERLRPGGSSGSCEAEFIAGDIRRTLRVVARLHPAGQNCLLVLLDLGRGG